MGWGGALYGHWEPCCPLTRAAIPALGPRLPAGGQAAQRRRGEPRPGAEHSVAAAGSGQSSRALRRPERSVPRAPVGIPNGLRLGFLRHLRVINLHSLQDKCCVRPAAQTPIYHHLMYIKAVSPLIAKANRNAASIKGQQQAGGDWGVGWVLGRPAFLPNLWLEALESAAGPSFRPG